MIYPEPPAWALAAGLPAPFEGESLTEYATRLGFSEEEQAALWVDLEKRVLDMAKYRLNHILTKKLPKEWETYKDARARAAIPAERLAKIRKRVRR